MRGLNHRRTEGREVFVLLSPVTSYRRKIQPRKWRFAVQMRLHPTNAEAMIWKRLVGKQTGFKFRRQHPMMGWIVDFCCNSRKVIVEIDGPVHDTPESLAYDKRREDALAAMGFRTLRFSNEQATRHTQQVIRSILEICDARPVFNSWNHGIRSSISPVNAVFPNPTS
jgi:very-short-patch-repair endonuclease